MSLLAEMNDATAREVLAGGYARLDEAASDSRPEPVRLRRLVLAVASNVKDDRIRDRVLDQLDQFDPGTQAAALEYLSNAGAGDPKVAEALRRLLRDPKSSLYKNHAGEQTLRNVTGGTKQ